MKTLVGGVAAAALCATGCTQSSTPAVLPAQTSAGIKAVLTTEEPPHTGTDVLVLTLTDAQTGQSIGDANITGRAEATSPRLPGQPNTGRAQGNGVYKIPVEMPVTSLYRIEIEAERPGKPTSDFSFKIDVIH